MGVQNACAVGWPKERVQDLFKRRPLNTKGRAQDGLHGAKLNGSIWAVGEAAQRCSGKDGAGGKHTLLLHVGQQVLHLRIQLPKRRVVNVNGGRCGQQALYEGRAAGERDTCLLPGNGHGHSVQERAGQCRAHVLIEIAFDEALQRRPCSLQQGGNWHFAGPRSRTQGSDACQGSGVDDSTLVLLPALLCLL